MLQSLQLLQGPLGCELALGCMKPLSQYPVEDESDKADAGMGLDSLGQPMKHRPDLDFGLQHTKAPLDIGKRLGKNLLVHRMARSLVDGGYLCGWHLGFPRPIGELHEHHAWPGSACICGRGHAYHVCSDELRAPHAVGPLGRIVRRAREPHPPT